MIPSLFCRPVFPHTIDVLQLKQNLNPLRNYNKYLVKEHHILQNGFI